MFEIKSFSLTNKTIVDVRKLSEHGLGVSRCSKWAGLSRGGKPTHSKTMMTISC